MKLNPISLLLKTKKSVFLYFILRPEGEESALSRMDDPRAKKMGPSQTEIAKSPLMLYLRSHTNLDMRQLNLLKKENKAYGGELLKTRRGRRGPRPLATRNSMHLVMRSSQAVGPLSFWTKENKHKIKMIVAKFSSKYGVRILSLANVGNHLHFHIQLGNRFTYRPFIRAISAAIAMAVTGKSRWKKIEGKFWDYRPFTRVVVGFKAFLRVRDYVRINQLEGYTGRTHATLIVKGDDEIDRLLSG